MAIALVQAITPVVDTANFLNDLALGAASMTTGNLFVFGMGYSDGAGAALNVPTDTAGNTYVQIGTVQWSGFTGNGDGVGLFYCPNATGNASNVITGHGTGALNSKPTAVAGWEFSGVATASPVDVSSGNHGNSGLPAPGALNPTQANDLLFVFAMQAVTTGWSAATGFTLTGATAVGATHGMVGAYEIQSGTTNRSAFFSGTNAAWGAVGVAFKAAGAGGGKVSRGGVDLDGLGGAGQQRFPRAG